MRRGSLCRYTHAQRESAARTSFDIHYFITLKTSHEPLSHQRDAQPRRASDLRGIGTYTVISDFDHQPVIYQSRPDVHGAL